MSPQPVNRPQPPANRADRRAAKKGGPPPEKLKRARHTRIRYRSPRTVIGDIKRVFVGRGKRP